MMKLPSILGALPWLVGSEARHVEQQVTLLEQQPQPPRIAIIGAGAAGSSTAYHLATYAAELGLDLRISIYERNSYVGGRSTTVDVYEDPTIRAELGASIFVEVNQILVDAVKAFNLSTEESSSRAQHKSSAPSLGIWDGQQFLVTLSPAGPSWWVTAKLLWKYGLSPIRTRNLMKAIVGKFLRMYETPYFPFESLSQAVDDVDLREAVAISGEKLLSQSSIGDLFANEIVQASTRVNYAQNLASIHGLETMVCMATDGAMAVQGGNWQIFDHMVQVSGAHLHLDTTITSIGTRADDHYELMVAYSPQPHEIQATYGTPYDVVVIAAPFHQANISIDVDHLSVPEDVPYVRLHVTLFTSPYRLGRRVFNVSDQQDVPLTVLTTLPKGEKPGNGQDSAGSPGFYSISTLDVLENPATGFQEYLYKIFSPQEASDKWIATLLDSEDDKATITWIYRKIWLSYPQENPRSTFDTLELRPNIWYTGAMEPFISTMETNALSGKNIARLIADRLASKDSKVKDED